jgi:hypothetical protein
MNEIIRQTVQRDTEKKERKVQGCTKEREKESKKEVKTENKNPSNKESSSSTIIVNLKNQHLM